MCIGLSHVLSTIYIYKGIRSAFSDVLCKEIGLTETPQLISIQAGGSSGSNPLKHLKQFFQYVSHSLYIYDPILSQLPLCFCNEASIYFLLNIPLS
jgi:hypothetical protein